MSCFENRCVQSYLCGKLDDPIKSAGGGESIAPFVKVFFGNPNNPDITVGNESSPKWDNTAIVKTFEYGVSDGAGVKIEIIDTAGGSFNLFMDKLTKCIANASSDYKMGVQWGWIVQQCTQGKRSTVNLIKSDNIKLQLTHIETTFGEGKIKYILTGTDTLQYVFGARQEEIKGTEPNPIPLTQAIRRLAMDKEPRFNVRFIMIKNGIEQELEWEIGGKEGPKAVWDSDGQNKLNTIQKWMEPFVSINRKGIVTIWDTQASFPTLVVMEDPTSGCNDVTNADCNSPMIIGRYMVNSGKCLHGESRIETEDGWKLIGNLYRNKYKGKVRCLDENGNLSWSNVYAWHRNPLDNRKLFKLNLLHSRKHYKNICGGIFTEDHEILTNYGYLKINELIKNKHKINSGTYALSKDCLHAFIGTMLGDSYFFKKTFECKHSLKQYEYCKYKANIFNCNFKEKTNKCLYSSKVNPFLRKMNELFYKEGIKKINEEVLKDFNLISLAFLFMDNGSTEFRKNKQPRSQIAVCKFTDEEVDLLVKKIKELGIDCYRRKNKYNRIFFDVENTKILSKSIAPYVLKLFNYKILEEHRNVEKTIIKNSQELFYDDFNLIKVDKTPKWVYCIGVEKYENFLTSSGIVHNCSPVISFTPQINWVAAIPAILGSGGNSGSAQSGASVVKEKECDVQTNEGGSGQSVAPPKHAIFVYGPKEAIPRTEYAQRKNAIAASMVYSQGAAIQAELRIQGDPKRQYCHPANYIGRFISLAVINPFNLHGDGNVEGNVKCGDWLATPMCNEVLSNKKWRILGASHSIKEGSYVTTLKLSLAVPGVELPPGQPIGGSGSLGYVPPNTC